MLAIIVLAAGIIDGYLCLIGQAETFWGETGVRDNGSVHQFGIGGMGDILGLHRDRLHVLRLQGAG